MYLDFRGVEGLTAGLRPAEGASTRRSMVGLIGGAWGMVAIGPKIIMAAPHLPTYSFCALLPTFRECVNTRAYKGP